MQRKKLLLAVLAIALLVGVVSAAVISYFGRIHMTANVKQAILVDGKDYTTMPIEETATVAGGMVLYRGHWLQSQTSVPVNVQFVTEYSPTLTDDEIKTEILEIFDEAYPASYTPPTSWDVKVSTLVDLQSAVQNTSNAGKTICVANGDYSGGIIEITIANIKLVSESGPASTTLKGVKISANGVTVKGFTIKPIAILGETTSVYLTPTLSNIEVSYNVLNGTGVSGSRGVLLGLYGGGASYTNVRIAHNVVHDLTTGIYTNPHTGIISIDHNEIYNTVAGIGGATGATIEYNTFHDNGEAIGADNSAANLTIRYNNFLGNDKVKQYETVSINAYNNWWDLDGIDVEGNVNASYMLKTDLTLQPYETDWFCIRYTFAVGIYPYTYTITTTVKPAP